MCENLGADILAVVGGGFLVVCLTLAGISLCTIAYNIWKDTK